MNHDTLEQLEQNIWRMLVEAATNAKSAMHLPVLSSIAADGKPRVRTLILQLVEQDLRELVFCTDRRSTKVRQFLSNSGAEAVFFDPVSAVQIRATGEISVQQGSQVEARWLNLLPNQKFLYRAEPAPGSQVTEASSGQPTGTDFDALTEEDVSAGRANFAVLVLKVVQIDWLFLTDDGNRAARFEWDTSGRQSASWRIP